MNERGWLRVKAEDVSGRKGGRVWGGETGNGVEEMQKHLENDENKRKRKCDREKEGWGRNRERDKKQERPHRKKEPGRQTIVKYQTAQ